MPLIYLIILFVAVPVTEFAILAYLATGEHGIGFFQTIALVLATGILGASLAKQQGVQTLTRIRGEMAAGRVPGDALFDGALILVAGAMLITPGILTDSLGFALLIPPLRAGVKHALKRWAAKNVRVATFTPGGAPGQGPPRRGSDEIIDAEVIETRVE